MQMRPRRWTVFGFFWVRVVVFHFFHDMEEAFKTFVLSLSDTVSHQSINVEQFSFSWWHDEDIVKVVVNKLCFYKNLPPHVRSIPFVF